MLTWPRTAPCEVCGVSVTKTGKEQNGRRHWTCGAECNTEIRRRGQSARWATDPRRVPAETRPCVVCGTPVTRALYPADRESRPDWVCSTSCRGQRAQERQRAKGLRGTKPRRGTEVPCGICGKPVYANKSQRATGQGLYCSRACFNIAQAKPPVIKFCGVCGKEMVLKPSQAAQKLCSQACKGIARTKRPGDRLHNGKPVRYDAKGYVLVWEPEHPNKAFHGWQYEHRIIMERKLGHYLRSDEAVHHINHVKDDNRDENLEVMGAIDHAVMSGRDWRDDTRAKLGRLTTVEDRLAEYERRFGPLP